MPILLTGANELGLRLDNMKGVFRVVGEAWEDETIRLARTRIRHRTGKALSSLRQRPVNRRGDASVSAIWYSRFEEDGTRAHEIQPHRFGKAAVVRRPSRRGAKVIGPLKSEITFGALHWGPANGGTFARRVHKRAQAGDHFLTRSATEAVDSVGILNALEKGWDLK